ncbi:MAG: DNA primase catalytic subunit PriS [Candidatus Methanomethylophilaceae archaeon]|nr:DNA primase catalytic subunit PriS [Candidatus Methanomethylophilaceae archaeon]
MRIHLFNYALYRSSMDANGRFLYKAFKRYYRDNRPLMPDRFTRREFGFMFFDRSFVQRHLSFRTPEELSAFMSGQIPSHSYYSTSYYRKPDAPKMDEKGWMGAELIFDLDADHLEGAEKMTYSEMLLQIRGEMISLVDNFLLGDLGFSEDQVHITFSGGRGYHAHVRTPDIMGLGTQERRELVDYITCSGLNIDWVFPVQTVATSKSRTASGTYVSTVSDRLLPPKECGGWRRRMRKALEKVIDDLCVMDTKQFKKEYPSSKNSTVIPKARDELIRNRTIVLEKDTMAFLSRPVQDLLVKVMKEDVARRLSGEVDEPVTADIKRLIRLPGSVHGKSGLRVTPVTREELAGFDPLESAVPDTYTDSPVKITMRRDSELRIKGENLVLRGETEVPEYAAVFLIGRKMADIGYASENEGKEKLFRRFPAVKYLKSGFPDT